MEGGKVLSIVIPVFEEAGRLPASIGKVVDFSMGLGWAHEAIWVVEKGSDGSLEIATREVPKQENFHVLDNKVHRGKGYAVRSGMGMARGEFVFFMDVDLSVPLETVLEFIAYFRKHPEIDVLVGNRQHAQSRIVRRQNRLRETMGKCYNWLIRRLVPVEIRDTQCGFKAFRAHAAREIFSRQKLDGFAFDLEVLLLAKKLGFKVVDLPVEWINSPESKVHIVRDSLRMLMDAVKVRCTLGRTQTPG